MSHHLRDRQHNGSCRGVSNHLWFIHPFSSSFLLRLYLYKKEKEEEDGDGYDEEE